jgi:hypothetical protein
MIVEMKSRDILHNVDHNRIWSVSRDHKIGTDLPLFLNRAAIRDNSVALTSVASCKLCNCYRLNSAKCSYFTPKSATNV